MTALECRGSSTCRRTLLREQLEERFGPLPPAALARLDAWPGERLTELGRAFVSTASLEEPGFGLSATSES
jgi:hypothetical protein